jgi:hypothetical protein
VHTFRFRGWIALSMITGKKTWVEEADKIQNSRAGAGAIFFAVFLGVALYLFQGLDSTSGKLNLFGSVISLGEVESEQEEGEESDSD